MQRLAPRDPEYVPRVSQFRMQVVCMLALLERLQSNGEPHLAAWMTVRSWTLEKAPTLMWFRSPLRTHPYHIDTCTAVNKEVRAELAIRPPTDRWTASIGLHTNARCRQ